MEEEATYVGIDVSKTQLDVAVRPTEDRWEAPNDEAGNRQLVSRLKTLEPIMVLLEASGGFELPLVAALAAEELPVVVVNPRQCGTLPRPPVSWPRPTLWTRRPWPTSPTPFAPRCALCEMPNLRPSTPWLPEGTS